jgi:hypothetical protein
LVEAEAVVLVVVVVVMDKAAAEVDQTLVTVVQEAQRLVLHALDQVAEVVVQLVSFVEVQS